MRLPDLFASRTFEFSTPLGVTAWAVLAGIPVGIIALYFLKLRRRPVRISSTLLWRKSLEDLHVNSLFQRLRRNLLLFLQLLTVGLAMLALSGIRLKSLAGQGERIVIAIDNSASMRATDVEPTRLDKAKEEARKVIDELRPNDLAMIISFSDRARVVSNYTGNRQIPRTRLDEIKPTESVTSLREALQVAAGLANPSKFVEGVPATSIVAPKLLLYTDGGFADVEGFSLGNLQPEVVVIGKPPSESSKSDPADAGSTTPRTPTKPRSASNNVAILALQTRRNDEKSDVYQVFGRVHNFRAEPVATEARLLRHESGRRADAGKLIDAISLTIPALSDQAFKFDLPDEGATELEVNLAVEDDQPLDNRAFTLVGSPRRAQILLVSAGNRYVLDALKTPYAETRCDITTIAPDALKTDEVKRDLSSGRYDLAIFDRAAPDVSPLANTLYFGSFPPGPAFEKSRPVEGPTILDVNSTHPLMQYIRDLPVVRVLKARVVEPPDGAIALVESNVGPLAFVAPREGFTDAIFGFNLIDGSDFNTDWVTKYSFPLFLNNALQILGNARESSGEELHQPGQSVTLRTETPEDSVKVRSPAGIETTLKRTPQGAFVYHEADVTGLYQATWGTKGSSAFAVNQFDFRECDLATRGLVPEGVPESKADEYRIKIGFNPVAAAADRSPPTMKHWWKPIAALVLAVLLLEWYIYNRRVYV